MSRRVTTAGGAALRCTRPLLAYNKSSGYRWSPIPKPPPPHFDRLYGTHSVLNTLRVAAQQQQRQQQSAANAQDAPQSTSVSPPAAAAAALAAAMTAPASKPQWHPHRAQLTCLYVRDFSAEEDQAGSDAGEGGRGKGPRGARTGGQGKKVIPARYTAVRCITALAKSMDIPVRFVPRAELVQLCGERRNQNIVLEASAYTPSKVRHLGEIWARQAVARNADVEGGDADVRPPVTVLFLEHIIDPTNIGGILRTAFFFGVDHVVLSRQCAACTAAVSRTSTGFLEHLHVYRATTSSVDFFRASQAAFRGNGGGEHRLDVVASTVVSEPPSASSASSAPLPHLHESEESSSSSSGDDATATGKGAAQDTHEAPAPASAGADPCAYPPAVRVLLLGNEDAGLPPELLQWCTHAAHVRSPRQARLRRARSSAASGGDGAPTAGEEGNTADALDSAAASSAGPARTELDKWQHNLRRLARLRDKEVSLNVNSATAALLSSLCSVPGALPTSAAAPSQHHGDSSSSSATVSYGLVEVRALRGAAPS